MTLSVSMTCLSVSFSDLCSYLGRQASLTLSQVRGESNLNSDLKPADPLADSIADFIAKNTEQLVTRVALLLPVRKRNKCCVGCLIASVVIKLS